MKKKWTPASQILVSLLIALLANVLAVLFATHKNLLASFAGFSVFLVAYVVVVLRNSADNKSQEEHESELREKSRAFWIDPMLDTLTDGPSWLQINLRRLDQTLNDGESRTLVEASIYDAYMKANRSLLILGAPGSGKTTAMLLLARQLADAAENDRADPVPVIFNLALWSPEHESFFLWLLHELREDYFLPEKVGRRLLEKNRLVLLLDGLEEVEKINRSSCVRAINEFIGRPNRQASSSILVCCEQDEYKSFEPLNLHMLKLETVPNEEIQRFLSRSASSKLKHALDTNESLRTLSKSPLMLTLIRAVHKGDSESLRSKWPTDVKEAQEALLDTYIDTRLSGISEGQRKALERLSTLADKLKRSNSMFLLERLQPSWLKNRRDQILYVFLSRLSSAMIGWLIGLAILWGCHSLAALLWRGQLQVTSPGLLNVQQGLWFWVLLTGVFGGLTVGLIDSFTLLGGGTPKWATYRKRLSGVFGVALNMGSCFVVFFITTGLTFGIRQGVLGGLTYGTIFGLPFWFHGRGQTLDNDVRTADKLSWNRLGLLKGFVWGAACGGMIGALAGFAVGALLGARSGGIKLACLCGATGVLIGSFVGVMKRVSIGDHLLSQNQGIIMSLRNTLWIFLCVGLPLPLLYWVLGILMTKDPKLVFESAVFFGLVIGFLLAFAYGGLDIIYHYVLRALLARKRVIPFRYVAFLNKAARLRLLTKVGGAYIFVHPCVRERLALRGADPQPNEAATKPPNETKAKVALPVGT